MKYKSKQVEVEAIRVSEAIEMIKTNTVGSGPEWFRAIYNGVDKICYGFLMREGNLMIVRHDGLQGGTNADYLFWTPQTGAMVAKSTEFEAAYDLVH